MKKILNFLLYLVIVFLIGFTLKESVGRLFDLGLSVKSPELFPEGSHHLHYAKNPAIMYIHVIAGIIFVLCGIHQLIPSIRRKNIRRHRAIGKIFLIISLIVSISALILAVFMPFGDKLESFTTLAFGLFLLFSSYKAYSEVRKGNIQNHSYWVRRVFFVSLSIATIRVIMIILMVNTGKSVQEVMGISFLIAFILHLIAVETWIFNHKRKLKFGS